MTQKNIAVVILNWNGKNMMERFLPSVLQHTPQADIVVADNASTDNSLEFLQEHYPHVRQIVLDENYGFCKAVNVGIKAAKTPYVILLNNDTQVLDGFVKNLYHSINRNKNIFSVSSMMIQAKKKEWIDDAGDYYCALGWAFARGKDKPVEQYEKPCKDLKMLVIIFI